jgi:hypothetical protein
MMMRLRWWFMRRFFRAEGYALYQRGRDEEYVRQFLTELEEQS